MSITIHCDVGCSGQPLALHHCFFHCPCIPPYCSDLLVLLQTAKISRSKQYQQTVQWTW